MAKYESGIKQIPYSQSAVYSKLSDLNNLAVIKERMNNPQIADNLKEKASEEQVQRAMMVVEKMEFTTDTMTIDMAPLGAIVIEIIEREPDKLIKMTSRQSPIPITFWIQILPTSETTSKMRLTIDAQLNPFMKMAFGNKLKDGIDQFAEMLAIIPYGEQTDEV